MLPCAISVYYLTLCLVWAAGRGDARGLREFVGDRVVFGASTATVSEEERASRGLRAPRDGASNVWTAAARARSATCDGADLSPFVALHDRMARCSEVASPAPINILVLGGSETSGVGCFCPWGPHATGWKSRRPDCQDRNASRTHADGFVNSSGLRLVEGRGRCPWAERVRVALKSMYACPTDVFNVALGGTLSAWAAAHLPDWLQDGVDRRGTRLRDALDLVVVEYGINDWSAVAEAVRGGAAAATAEAELRAATEAILRALLSLRRAPGTRVPVLYLERTIEGAPGDAVERAYEAACAWYAAPLLRLARIGADRGHRAGPEVHPGACGARARAPCARRARAEPGASCSGPQTHQAIADAFVDWWRGATTASRGCAAAAGSAPPPAPPRATAERRLRAPLSDAAVLARISPCPDGRESLYDATLAGAARAAGVGRASPTSAWALREDVPGKPGWLLTAPTGDVARDTLAFDVVLGARRLVVVDCESRRGGGSRGNVIAPKPSLAQTSRPTSPPGSPSSTSSKRAARRRSPSTLGARARG